MNNVVDILYGASASYSFKKSNINNLVLEFDTVFSVADLSNIDKYKLTYQNDLFEDYDFSENIKILNSLIDTHLIRIWCSRKDSDSYILLCYLCNYLKDKTSNISVIYSDDYDYNTPAIIRDEEFSKVLSCEHNLSISEINELSNIFDNIKNNNCELRIMKSNEVLLESYDYYNDIIIELLKGKKIKVSSLVGQLLANYDHLVDIIYCFLILRLINRDIIEIESSSERFFNNIIMLKEK